MKKRNLFFALAAGMVMFSACSNDDDVINGGNNGVNEDVQRLVLQVASSGDGLQTRAVRPLLSSAATQDFENLKVLVCKKSDGSIVADTLLTDWNTSSQEYTKGGHGQEKAIVLSGHNKLAAGEQFVVYAFGFDKDSKYKDATGNSSIKDLLATYGNGKAESTDLANKETVKQYNGNLILNGEGEEIFAGSVEFTVPAEANQGFNQPVVLHRQVAGVFTYIKEIPYLEGATKLQLYAVTESDRLVLGNFLTSELEQNGENVSSNVVNGFASSTKNETLVTEELLSDWFIDPAKNKDGLIDATDNWSGDSQKFAEGSVFMGKFLNPFQKGATTTFVLKLVKDNNDELRSWAIKLPTKDIATSLTAWNSGENKFASVSSYTETVNNYSVLRNHLYGVGTRMKDEPETPGEPDIDEPESLNNKQELTLRVNDNWEVIHNMEIE